MAMRVKAKESAHVSKMREKVKSHISKQNQKITKRALDDVEKTMEGWLERHSGERKSLENKEIELFDANRHPAPVKSEYIKHLKTELKQGLSRKPKSLKGRIKH